MNETSLGGDGIRDLRALADALPFDVWVRDVEQVCVYRNQTAARNWPRLTIGSRPEDGGGSPEVVAIWRANNERAMRGDIVRGEVEYEIEGRRRTMVNFIAPITVDGKVVGTAGANIDVTDIREREQEIARLQSLVFGIFENAPIPIGVRALRGDDIVHVHDNPKAASLFGRTPEALRGRSERELGVDDAVVRHAISRFRQARASEGPLPFEVTYKFTEEPRTLTGTIAALPSDHGEERYLVFGEDTTELRTLQSGMMRADRLAALGTLAAGIAHEINNPLTYMQTLLALATRKLERMTTYDPKTVSDALEDMRTAMSGIERVATLTSDLLSLARPERAQASTLVDIGVTIESVLGLAASDLRRTANVVRDVGKVSPVRGNGVRLGQVLLNLVNNAAQALDERGGGTIWISAHDAPNGRVRILVADDGPGIPASIRDRLFSAFASGRSEGNGLGLYISRQIVEGMGGTLEASDREGGGTVMVLDLPKATD